MDKNEEIEILALKKEMDEVGEKNMSKEKKARYIDLRHKQKIDRRTQQEKINIEHKKPVLGKFGILLGFIPFLVIALIVWMVMSANWKDYKGDCVIGQDPSNPNCFDSSSGVGHPLWNN